MNKKFLKVTMAALLGMTLAGCDNESLVESIAGDEEEDQHSSSSLYLKDANGAGVVGISYSCFGGYVSGDGDMESREKLITSGNTSSAGDMSISYWPGYEVECTITPVSAPELYLYNVNGPINNAQVNCTSSGGFTGEDGHDGSINNASSDTCTIRPVIN